MGEVVSAQDAVLFAGRYAAALVVREKTDSLLVGLRLKTSLASRRGGWGIPGTVLGYHPL